MMLLSGFFVDANLLVLLVAGSVNPILIAKHRRLESYTAVDYQVLLDLINLADRVFVTPNTLTEASNLLGQHGEPERSLLIEGLRVLIDESEEIVVSSAQAAANAEFHRLGLTDATLLEVASEDRPLITVDRDLYSAAVAKGHNAAFDFWRESRSR